MRVFDKYHTHRHVFLIKASQTDPSSMTFGNAYQTPVSFNRCKLYVQCFFDKCYRRYLGHLSTV